VDAGFRTPLLDFFRRGDVARDVRLLAAQGALAPRAQEQLALLMLLVSDIDPEIVRAAEATIASIPRDSLALFLGRSGTPAELASFFAARGIEPAPGATGMGDAPLVYVAAHVDGQPELESEEIDDESSALQRLASMTIAQRMTRAMKGSREERSILIRDPNKIVAVAVLSSPKLSESEVEGFARMANVSEEILRIIASTRAWIKSYPVVLALVKNAKTPVALSMNLLARLNERDLRQLSTDRNVADVVRLTARKKIADDR
jgi:hypothetical protein